MKTLTILTALSALLFGTLIVPALMGKPDIILLAQIDDLGDELPQPEAVPAPIPVLDLGVEEEEVVPPLEVDPPNFIQAVLSSPGTLIEALLQLVGGAAILATMIGNQSANKYIKVVLNLLNFLAANFGKAKNAKT
jgi:hypothetical protein